MSPSSECPLSSLFPIFLPPFLAEVDRDAVRQELLLELQGIGAGAASPLGVPNMVDNLSNLDDEYSADSEFEEAEDPLSPQEAKPLGSASLGLTQDEMSLVHNAIVTHPKTPPSSSRRPDGPPARRHIQAPTGGSDR